MARGVGLTRSMSRRLDHILLYYVWQLIDTSQYQYNIYYYGTATYFVGIRIPCAENKNDSHNL